MTTSASRPRRVVLPAAIDLVLVVVFVWIGRGFHNEGQGFASMVVTAWPFVVGLALAWLVTRAWRNPWPVVRPGIGIWIVTVAAAMMLRFISGSGTAVSFIIVAAVVLALLLVGWRALAHLLVRNPKLTS
jgi:hypothetical protein